MRTLAVLVLWLAAGAAHAEAAGNGAPAPTILVWGDSISAAYGIPLESGWARLLQKRLEGEGYPHRVVNGSVTGETTAGGLARLPAALRQHQPSIVLIELGGNDGLRGLPIAELRTNLSKLVRLSREAGARAALFEMRIPTNYGAAYAGQFQDSFATVARDHAIAVVPFFLAGAVEQELFQDDGIHPTAAAQPLMLEAAWPVIARLLRDPGRAR